MSIKVLEGSLEILELLLYLEPAYPITSYEIRQRFVNTKEITLLKRLNKLASQGLVEKRKKDKILPGGDKFEYQLTDKGQEIRTQLMQKALKMIPPSFISNQLTDSYQTRRRKPNEKEREDLIREILVNIASEIENSLQSFIQENAPQLKKDWDIDKNELLKAIQRTIQKELRNVL